MDKPLSLNQVSFQLNSTCVDVHPDPGERLSAVLRERLASKDVKVGCDAGDCGACTVLLNGMPVCACLVLAHQADGQSVETVKGLVQNDPVARALATSFQEHGAAQCGICTPGMMVSAVALLREHDSPDEHQIADALGGVLCRCTGYRKIFEAILNVGTVSTKEDPNGHVGSSIQRLDGNWKVTGSERFGDDIAAQDALVVRVIRSQHHRAAFEFGDLNLWLSRTQGIEAILTNADVKGENCFGVIPDFADQPVFAENECRFKGEAVAAVVGTPSAITSFDPSDFPVTWHRRQEIMTIAEATADDAELLHASRKNNVLCGGFVTTGDPEQALSAADVTVEGSFKTAFVEHAYIEPEAGMAVINGGRLEVHACTQSPVMDLEALAALLGMPREDIRIVPTGVGGGFGSKLDLSVQPFLALAALKTERPVRMAYSRTESMQSTTKRHPAEISMKIGATRDGHIKGVVFDGLFNTGAYASWGPTVANRVPVHASGPYKVADYRASAKGIHTHCPPSGAFRGFGVPQTAIAQESLFDELADNLVIDRLEFRLRNALKNGDPTVCGQSFETGTGIKACFEALRVAWNAERLEAQRKNSEDGALLRGVGIAGGWYGCGNTSLPNPSTIKVGISPAGDIILHQGAVDIGQGSNTAISQIFATALGVSCAQVKLVGADTDITPDAGKTSASRQTFISGNAARLAGEALRSRILSLVNAAKTAKLEFRDDQIFVSDSVGEQAIDLKHLPTNDDGYVLWAEETYDPPIRALDENGQGHPYAQFGYAAHLAVVDVDAALGTVHPVKIVAAHDVGKAINPLLVEGQVHGGVAQGLGMALMEEYLPGKTENLHDYLIPTIGDIPPIETLIIEESDAHGPYGAKGLGEHALIPTAPAILNAIKDATGVRMTEVPVTPARLRAKLRELERG